MGDNYTNLGNAIVNFDLNTITGKDTDTVNELAFSDDLYEIMRMCCDREIETTDAKDVIANIISYESDINIAYEPAQSDDCAGNASLVFETTMPWFYNPKEKDLTEIALNNILMPYAAELGLNIPHITDIVIEYYG